MRRIFILALLALAVPLAAKKKPKGAPLMKLPEQTLELKHFAAATPAQKCTNWAWAVAVEAMLRAQNVPLDQRFWVTKVNYGEICVDAAPDLDQLVKAVNGSYILNDGRHVTLQAALVAGSLDPDSIILPLRRGLPVLMLWKGRAFLLRGAVFDEYIYPNNQRMFQVRELKLLDPLATGKDRDVSFLNGRDNPADVAGLLSVTATPVERQSWQTKTTW